MNASGSFSISLNVLKVASYLTEPLCRVRENFYTFYVLDQISEGTLDKISRAAGLALEMLICGILTPFTAPLGVVLRGAFVLFSKDPYIYQKLSKEEKYFEGNTITIASYNQCYMPGGYAITDGQVMPPRDETRLFANIQKVKGYLPDILCFQEVCDIHTAEAITRQISQDYPYVIPVSGVRTAAPSSMMYVASKSEIEDVEFTSFVRDEELTGRSKYSGKGFLSFSLKTRNVQVICTHLQHSEEPARPTEEEKNSRVRQMEAIAKKVDRVKSVIFAGDFNMGEDEMGAFLEKHPEFSRDPKVQNKNTWLGDAWCAKLMGKQPSPPQVLDYTLAARVQSITTEIDANLGYQADMFQKQALSDHCLLVSTVHLQ